MNSQLYTAKGAATKLNEYSDRWRPSQRLCGYYLAEGFIGKDVGRAGAVRGACGLRFHEDETGYIEDVRRILSRWGLKFIERHSTHARTTIVSSRVLSWLRMFRRGTRRKTITFCSAFNVSCESADGNLFVAASSGARAVTKLQGGRSLMFEYATEKPLAYENGHDAAAQTLGVIPSVRRRWMNKSTRLAYIIRVAGYHQLKQLRDVFGDNIVRQSTSSSWIPATDSAARISVLRSLCRSDRAIRRA